MKEDFIHFLWRYGLYDSTDLYSCDNLGLTILKPGQANPHSGPDFFNSHIKIDDALWIGTVEIHIRSSDWYKHKHDKDPAYDTVILHVVYKHDQKVFRYDGTEIPTLELQGKIDSTLLHTYEMLIENLAQIPCESRIAQVDTFTKNSWLERMRIERLEYKSKLVYDALHKNTGDWEQVCYELFARNFGFNVNSDAFEQLAKNISYKIVLKNADNLFKLEALLFGQAGMLLYKFDEEYPNALKKEYTFLKKKYNLQPISVLQWRYMRLRPRNFPSLRIAQFAAWLHQSNSLLNQILISKSVEEWFKSFEIKASEYWDTHYRLDKLSTFQPKKLGKDAIRSILINTVAVFLFAYGKEKNIEKYMQDAFSLMLSLEKEEHAALRLFENIGMPHANAFDSQALLHLKKNYCDEKKCLTCGIGLKIIKQS